MKHASKFIVATLFILSIHAEAASFEVVGVGGEILLKKNVEAVGSVGNLSDLILMDALQTGRLSEYVGSTRGVTSINRLGSALEVLSDTEMNAYGWCYLVDGIESGRMADEFVLTGNERSVKWFYAYAHLVRDVWTEMCVPADHLPRDQ